MLHGKHIEKYKQYYFEHSDQDKVKKAKKIYQYDKNKDLIKIWNSINKCNVEGHFSPRAILYSISDGIMYENSYWSYENWCPLEEKKAPASVELF